MNECIERVLEEARREGRRVLLLHEAYRLLECVGLPVPKYGLARSPEEAEEIAKRIGGRLALKIVSPDIVHKSDVGGVVLGVEPGRVREEYERLVERVAERAPGARVVACSSRRWCQRVSRCLSGV